MPGDHHPQPPLVEPTVDGVGLFRDVEERFSDMLEILQLVAASSERALFVARDRVLKRRVALRVHLQPDTALRCWFVRETELMAALDHPVLRTVHTAGYRGDWAYRIVGWIDGESLSEAAARGPRPIPSTLQLARNLAILLDYVHSQRIVIRRIVPTSVMVDNTERPFVTDLRWANVLLDVAAPDPVPGNVPFLAPEIRGGEPGEPGSDIYAAGAILYYAAIGAAPAADPEAIVSPRSLREACPAALERVVMRALQPEPNRRYLSASEMLDDLQSDLGDYGVQLFLTGEHGVPLDEPAVWEKQLRRALGDDYELLEELGSGGFGRVYRVRDLELEREVALKVLHPYLTTDPTVVERFRREAQVAAQVMHPNIANTYGLGGRGGLIWYTMEYVHGKNLSRLVKSEGPLSAERTVQILHEALGALRYAHRRGLVHRDIKPENLLIEDGTGTVHLADFGLAIAFERTGSAGGTSSHSGTPDFAAPEQLLGEPVDLRADLYSLSLVGLYALTGQLPFGGGSVESTLARQAAGQLPELYHLRGRVPEPLIRVLVRGAARDPDDRYESADAYAEVLDDAMKPWRTSIRGLFRRFAGPS